MDLIIWDEAPMTHRYAFEALDCTSEDLRNTQEPMGSGDYTLWRLLTNTTNNTI